MEKNYVLFAEDFNKYWTGAEKIWFSPDIRDAQKFKSEEELIKYISTTQEEDYLLNEKLHMVKLFSVKPIYIADNV
jgi:hypothetical protein